MAKKTTSKSGINATPKGPASSNKSGKSKPIGAGRTDSSELLRGRQHTDSPRSEPSQRTPAHGKDRRGGGKK